MKIVITGWFGGSNCGDEAFKIAHAEIFRGHDYQFVTPPRNLPPSDIYVLGGGAVVSPYYLDGFPDDGRPRYAIGVDLAYESEAELLKKARFDEVLVRHRADLDLLRSRLTCPVSYVPDLAYALFPTGQDLLRWYQVEKGRRILGVMLTDYVLPAIDRPVEKFRGRADSFVAVLAHELNKLRTAGWEPLLIPLSTGGYGNDLRVNLEIASFLKNLPAIVMDTLSPQECVNLIAQCDATLCMKFHAHIFSIIAGTPFVSIPFTRKVRLTLAEEELSGYACGTFEGDKFCGDGLLEAVEKAYKDRDLIRRSFLGKAYSQRAMLNAIIERVRRDWLGALP